MKTNEIIQKVLTILNINATQLSLEIGASKSRIDDIIIGKTKKITPATAKLIIERFPNISYNFLIHGEGSPYADGTHVPPVIEQAMSTSDIMKTLLSVYQVNANQLSIATGISRGNISNLISGNARPFKISKENAKRITAVYPAVRWEWLVTGKGPMFVNGMMPPVKIEEPQQSEKPKANESEYVTKEDIVKLLNEAEERNDKKFNKIMSILLEDKYNAAFVAEDIIRSKD